MCNFLQPPLRAVPASLFPTLDTLDEAVAYGVSKVPLQANELKTVLMVYHNTLLNQINVKPKD